VRADLGSTSGVVIAELWSELVAGRSRVVDWFCTNERCMLIIESGRPFLQGELDARRREILEGVILCAAQKRVAFEFGVAIPTVAALCKEALEYLNIGVSYAKIPIALVVFVHSHRGQTNLRVARRSTLTMETSELSVVGFQRPDLGLEMLLSRAEYRVARLYVEGMSHAEIASIRRISQRTVANQLASVFHKLHVSGRAALLAWLTTQFGRAVPEPSPDNQRREREAPDSSRSGRATLLLLETSPILESSSADIEK
jgi:DNA-binding CsgD family transcriptional regulator